MKLCKSILVTSLHSKKFCQSSGITCMSLWIRNYSRRGFSLPQRSHLRTLKNLLKVHFRGNVVKKSGKRCEKSGKHWIKSGNREILRQFIFFLYPRLCSRHFLKDNYSISSKTNSHAYLVIYGKQEKINLMPC